MTGASSSADRSGSSPRTCASSCSRTCISITAAPSAAFRSAQHIVQRIEYEYAFNPDWFSAGAYIRADFDRPGLDWKFLGGEYTDNFDLFGDGVLRMIFTPGHSPGHQSFLLTLPNTGPMLLTIDAAYTMDHWNDKALPGLVCSSVDAVHSVHKLHKIAEDTGAMVVTGHDPDSWKNIQEGAGRLLRLTASLCSRARGTRSHPDRTWRGGNQPLADPKTAKGGESERLVWNGPASQAVLAAYASGAMAAGLDEINPRRRQESLYQEDA